MGVRMTKVVYTRVPDPLHRKLVALAKANRRTLSAEAQVALEGHVSEQKKEQS